MNNRTKKAIEDLMKEKHNEISQSADRLISHPDINSGDTFEDMQNKIDDLYDKIDKINGYPLSPVDIQKNIIKKELDEIKGKDHDEVLEKNKGVILDINFGLLDEI